ncbi:MAG: hypothetical protein WA151_05380 [Desulfatirhabdiaceae bacterium]
MTASSSSFRSKSVTRSVIPGRISSTFCRYESTPSGTGRKPKQFNWLDHRLIHDRYIEQCSHPAAALYLFL